MKKNCSGTILTSMNKEDFYKLPFPILNPEIQSELKNLLSESFRLRRESKALLEQAKRAVELAIETDETQAMAWLAEQKNGTSVA